MGHRKLSFYIATFIVFFYQVHSITSECVDGNYYSNESDCGAFYQCSNGQLIGQRCPGVLYFNTVLNVCDYPENVQCGGPTTTRLSTTATPTTTPRPNTTHSAPTTEEAITRTTTTDKVFCYFQSTAEGRSGNGTFTVENINAKLCTHIAFGFIGLNTDGSVKVLDWTLIEKFMNLKSSNPNVKLLAAIGGWNEGSVKYSGVAASAIKRSTFVSGVYDFLEAYGFDGLDFNWQYPGLRGGLYQQDKINFVSLLKELKERFAGSKLLTATVGATEQYLELSYDAVQMNEYLDLISLSSYDYYGTYDAVTGRFPPDITGLNAPLYSSKAEANKQLNQNASVYAWISAGVNPSKLLLGIPFYGRGFVLTTANNSIGAPCTPGPPGPYTADASRTVSYLEVCEKYKSSSSWTSVFDGQQKVPYFYNDNEWISYDCPRSVQMKAEYAVNQNLAGVMLWSVDLDDAQNVCGGGAYPLLNSINKVLSRPTTDECTCGSKK